MLYSKRNASGRKLSAGGKNPGKQKSFKSLRLGHMSSHIRFCFCDKVELQKHISPPEGTLGHSTTGAHDVIDHIICL